MTSAPVPGERSGIRYGANSILTQELLSANYNPRLKRQGFYL